MLRWRSFHHSDLILRVSKKRGIALTRGKLGVLHLSVVGAAALVEARIHGRAAVPQRAGAAAHVGVRGVEVLRTLESLVIVPVRVQPAVAVLPLCVRYPQVPGQISEQQAVQQAHHPGGGFYSPPHRVPEGSAIPEKRQSELSAPHRGYFAIRETLNRVTVILPFHAD